MSSVAIDLEALVKTASLALRDLDPAIRDSIAEEVGQRLARKVIQWNDRSFAWKSARNEAMSLFREKKWAVPATLLADEESGDDYFDNVPSPTRTEADEDDVPFCVIEARLKANYGNGNKHAYQAIVHAYYFLLGYSHTEIVGELSEQPLQGLAESLVSTYGRSSKIPRSRLPSLFTDLFRVKGTADGKMPLSEYWSPNATASRWAAQVGDCVQDLDVVQGKPTFSLSPAIGKISACARLVYLFQEFAEVTPARMVREYAAETLDSLVIGFERVYAERHSVNEVDVRKWFGSLLSVNRTEGKYALRKYFSPQHSISLWIQSVDRRLTSETHYQEEKGLELVFAQGEPWKTIAFTYTCLLKWSAEDVARKAGKSLRATGSGTGFIADLELDYQAAWAKTTGKKGRGPRATIDLEVVRGWLKPLRSRLLLLPEGATLKSKAVAEFGPGGDVALAISLWRAEILRKVTPLLTDCKQLPLFSWRHGLIEEKR